MLKLRPYQEKCLTVLKARLKETDVPLLVNASVGSGKSLIISELLLVIERAGWRALCLTMNSTLIRQNEEAYNYQGGHAGVFCAALGRKESDNPVIFASPQSIMREIGKGGRISGGRFNLIVVDEAHNINISDPKTNYIKIFNWYAQLAKQYGHKIRFVGLTGTPYRGKGISIVGNSQFFKEEVCSISAEWLISQGYLTKPIWGLSNNLKYDFEDIKTNSMGRFDYKEIKGRVLPRLTAKIMERVQSIVQSRRGAFIFATSIEHCKECMCYLPENETALITGDTPDYLRHEYITRARLSEIKYLVNVNVLCTGVDVPNFDTVVFVRPTESLVLYMQAIGRGLRLYPGKQDCLVLDYAGNLERHGDIDNPIINEAVKQQSKNDPDYCIPCYECQTFNKVTARRCIGTIQDKRCEHYFEFKQCVKCNELNDITARYCRTCKFELLDPNRNLKKEAAITNTIELKVIDSKYWVIKNEYPVFCAKYKAQHEVSGKIIVLRESYILKSKISKDIFFAKFVREQFVNRWQAYLHLDNTWVLESTINEGKVKTPNMLIAKRKDDGTLRIYKKLFT